MPKPSSPPRRNVGFKGGRQDGSDEKEVVPNFEQAGPFFLPETTGAGQQKINPPRESTPAELPGFPLDPPSYDKEGQNDRIDRKPEPDGTRPSTPAIAPPGPPKFEVNILNVSINASSNRPATPVDGEPVPKSTTERDPVKKNGKVELSDRERRNKRRLEKLAGRRPLWGS